MEDLDSKKLSDDDWWAVSIVNKAMQRMEDVYGGTDGAPDVGFNRYMASILVELKKALAEGK